MVVMMRRVQTTRRRINISLDVPPIVKRAPEKYLNKIKRKQGHSGNRSCYMYPLNVRLPSLEQPKEAHIGPFFKRTAASVGPHYSFLCYCGDLWGRRMLKAPRLRTLQLSYDFSGVVVGGVPKWRGKRQLLSPLSRIPVFGVQIGSIYGN